YARFYALKQNEDSQYVNDTKHSLFLTSIIVGENFWKTLPEKYHSLFKEAAINAARLERKHSIEDAEATKEKCKTEGIPVVTLSVQEQERFKESTKGVYEKYRSYFSTDYVSQIKKN